MLMKRFPLLTVGIIAKTLMTADSLSSSSGGVAKDARSQGLFQTTPLVESLPLSKLCAPHRCVVTSFLLFARPTFIRLFDELIPCIFRVYLKLDLLQQSGSFKDRGMAHLCATTQKVYTANRQREADGVNGSSDADGRIKVISSSGGNAGLAVTTVARKIPQMDVSGKNMLELHRLRKIRVVG